MNKHLTEKEKKFLKKFIKSNEKYHYNYYISGILLLLCTLGFILGITFRSKDGFLMAIFFGTISIILILKTITYKRIVNILKKYED